MALGFGIVGCGVIGTTHARGITNAGGRLVSVTDGVRERAEKFAADYGAEVDSLDGLLERSDIDVISVCTPSGSHRDVAVAALRAGKHVVIEKPIDITLAAADEIIDARDAGGRKAAVISQRRFSPGAGAVHDAVVAGRFGQVSSGLATMAFWRSDEYYASAGWRGTKAVDGGGALMNQGIHAIDLLLWMLGPAVEVVAYAERLVHHEIEVEDTATAIVRFASGAVGTILGTTAAYPGPGARVQVHGDAGSAAIVQDELSYFHTRDLEGEVEQGNQADVAQSSFATDLVEYPSAPYHSAQYADFIAAVRDDRAPAVGVEDGRRALELILAIYESSSTRAPVRIG